MDTIAAISTANGIGGIGVIRISGENAVEIADKVFVSFDGVSRLSSLKGYRAKYGKVIKDGKFIDEAIALVFKAPHSYTGEDVVEISCHGGLYITRQVLRTVLDAGASLAGAGEFTKRAFLNGKVDLSQAEAVMDIIAAKSEHANAIAFNQKEGTTSKKVKEIKNELLDISANLSVWADYPEEDIPQINSTMLNSRIKKIRQEIFKMIKDYDVCVALKEGVKTVIIGRPNVGKSTLMNLISGTDKSIVTEIAGTTRDIVEETVMIGDIPLLLVDTAGIRSTEDLVEKIGVEKAKNCIKVADIVLAVIDASKPLTEEDEEVLKSCNSKKTLIILNKIDLGIKVDVNKLSTFSDRIVEMSVIKGEGVEDLRKALEEMVGISKFEPSEALISNERQLLALKKAYRILDETINDIDSGVTLDAVTVLLEDAMQTIMELTGENVSEEVINKVFSKFCVGK